LIVFFCRFHAAATIMTHFWPPAVVGLGYGQVLGLRLAVKVNQRSSLLFHYLAH